MLTMLMWIARLYLWRWLPGGKRARFYSINVMRARHPAWFREDLERLFGLLATGAIRPRVAERISFDEVAEAHRRLEAGGLDGKLVLCPALPYRRSIAVTRVPVVPAGNHREHEIFSVHETGDRHPKDVRDHERHGDIRDQTMQFAYRAFRLLPSRLRNGPVPGFIAVCIGVSH